MLAVCACNWWPVHAHAMPRVMPHDTRHHDDSNGAAHAASLTAAMTVNTRAAMVGSMLVYTLTLSNTGDTPATFAVTDTLPDSLALVDAPAMNVSGQTLTADGTLKNGAQQQFVIRARIHLYQSTIEHEAIVRVGDQTERIAAPVVRVASPGASFLHYLPLMLR